MELSVPPLQPARQETASVNPASIAKAFFIVCFTLSVPLRGNGCFEKTRGIWLFRRRTALFHDKYDDHNGSGYHDNTGDNADDYRHRKRISIGIGGFRLLCRGGGRPFGGRGAETADCGGGRVRISGCGRLCGGRYNFTELQAIEGKRLLPADTQIGGYRRYRRYDARGIY